MVFSCNVMMTCEKGSGGGGGVSGTITFAEDACEQLPSIFLL